ncbi:LysM peptidoglycan-binding domain-containing protein [Chryseobacterium sp. A301]
MIKRFLLLSAVVFGFGASAQSTHTVIKGDTPYNISKKYGLSINELYRLNPSVVEGTIKLGDVLTVTRGSSQNSAQSTTGASTGVIVLQPKQTIYGITKTYRISEADLRKLNPELDSHMKIGDKVVLPLENIRKYGPESAVVVSEANVNTVKPTAPEEVSDLLQGQERYEVQPRDNYYRITRKFKLSQAELFSLNPGLESKGLQPGDFLVVSTRSKSSDDSVAMTELEPAVSESIPVSTVNREDVLEESGDYLTYTVRSGDTVFGILNEFKITLDQLLSLNPSLSGGLKAGMVLKIKSIDSQYVKKSGDQLNVVLMLPFGFDAGDSKYRSLASDFLSGAKLAIERSAAGGQKLNINIVDSGNDTSFKNSLSQIQKENTDLIIGPFFKSGIVEVLDYVGSSKIPVVAPFANTEDLYGHSNLIIVETKEDIYADRIVEEAEKVFSNQKVYIVADSDKTQANRVKAGLEKSLKNASISIVTSVADIVSETNMMTGQPTPVIAILASNNDSLGKAFGERMIQMSNEIKGNRAFSLYYHSIFESQMDALSQANLVYLMDRKVNMEGKFEKEILAAYQTKYCKSPSRYAIIGFDVVNDILSRENKNGEVFKQIDKVQTQLATKFEYVRAKRNGAYINTGYRVVRLVP